MSDAENQSKLEMCSYIPNIKGLNALADMLIYILKLYLTLDHLNKILLSLNPKRVLENKQKLKQDKIKLNEHNQ